MNSHRFILEKYTGPKSRYDCPGCGKRREFSRYIDTETGQHLAEYVGRCNREINCGYHVKPKQYFETNTTGTYTATFSPKPKEAPKPTSYIDFDVYQASLRWDRENKLIEYFHRIFKDAPEGTVNNLLYQYLLGTSKHWKGATVFWQIDTQGDVRTGKIMLYRAETGKRVKDSYSCITWVHRALKLPDFNLKQCFFGEHLLRVHHSLPVAIVESEKTAMIASVYFPQYVWLAVGSLTNLTAEKCAVLKGREVYLFPDLNGYEKWEAKVKELKSITSFYISDLLECNSTAEERDQGLDLADFLIRYPYTEFHHL